MVKAFAMIETKMYGPLSITLKGRYFEHCVVNERAQCAMPEMDGIEQAWWYL
jgi:hypothetical protein